jgi:hypothetical protein
MRGMQASGIVPLSHYSADSQLPSITVPPTWRESSLLDPLAYQRQRLLVHRLVQELRHAPGSTETSRLQRRSYRSPSSRLMFSITSA